MVVLTAVMMDASWVVGWAGWMVVLTVAWKDARKAVLTAATMGELMVALTVG